METNVVVNVQLLVNLEHHTDLTDNLKEKLARDKVVDILDCGVNHIIVKDIGAIVKGT